MCPYICTVTAFYTDQFIWFSFLLMQFEQYPMSLSYLDDQLWVGDKTGLIHLIDATDGDFNIVEVCKHIATSNCKYDLDCRILSYLQAIFEEWMLH